jgi:iron(III) transport system permease protein
MPAAKPLASRSLVVLLAAAVVLLAVWAASPAASQRALANSAILAAGATAIALPLGTILAILIARFDLPGRRLAAAALGLLLVLPLYMQLSGWDAAFGKLGWFTLMYRSVDLPVLAGMPAVIVIHGMAAVPWVALIVGLGLSQVDPVQEEAALLVMPPAGVLLNITLPQTLPFLFAAGIWAAVSTTTEMTVTNIYLINPGEWTYTEHFYMTASLQADAGEAAMSALPGMIGLAVLIVISTWIVARCAPPATGIYVGRPVRFAAGPLRWILAALLWLIVLVLLLVVASLMSKAGFVVEHLGSHPRRSVSAWKCLTEVATAPWRFRFELGWTLATAAGAATIALLAAVGLAWPARRGGWRGGLAIVIVALALAIPGPLVGAGLIGLFNRPLWPGSFDPLIYLYDNTPLVVMLAQAIHALPLATLIAWHSFRTLSGDVLAAAALDGASPWRVFWRIALPQRWPAMVAAWLAAFAIAAGDLAWGQLVRPAGMDLIQRRVFGLMHSGVEEQVAAISLVNVIAYAVLAGLILWLLRRVGPARAPRAGVT